MEDILAVLENSAKGNVIPHHSATHVSKQEIISARKRAQIMFNDAFDGRKPFNCGLSFYERSQAMKLIGNQLEAKRKAGGLDLMDLVNAKTQTCKILTPSPEAIPEEQSVEMADEFLHI